MKATYAIPGLNEVLENSYKKAATGNGDFFTPVVRYIDNWIRS